MKKYEFSGDLYLKELAFDEFRAEKKLDYWEGYRAYEKYLEGLIPILVDSKGLPALKAFYKSFKRHRIREEWNAKYNYYPREKAVLFDFEEIKITLSIVPASKRIEFWERLFKEFDEFVSEPENSDFLQKVSLEMENVRVAIALNNEFSQTGISGSTSPNKSLVWKESVNGLCAVFFNLKNDGFIESSKPELVKWILSNFLDKNGHELNKSTIETGISNNKPLSRGKNPKFESDYLTESP